jgi:hypothetical protein
VREECDAARTTFDTYLGEYGGEWAAMRAGWEKWKSGTADANLITPHNKKIGVLFGKFEAQVKAVSSACYTKADLADAAKATKG